MVTEISAAEMPAKTYYARKDRVGWMRPGYRIVQLLNLAHSKGQPALAIYRPLDREAPVYQAGQRWDYKPLEEFLDLYVPYVDEADIKQLDALRAELYGD